MTAEAARDADKLRLPRLEERIAAEIAAVESRIRELQADLTALKQAHRSLSSRRGADSQTPPIAPRKRNLGRWKGGSDAETLRTFVSNALKEAGRPLSRKEIYELMLGSGVSLGSKNPLKRISKVMWESEEFRSTPAGYWFAESFYLR